MTDPITGQSRWTLIALALLVAFVLATPGGAAPPESSAPDPRHLIEAYNARDLGGPGFRRVRLDLRNGSQVTQTFQVVNLWRRDGEATRTTFVLEEPSNLLGTNYLLVEDPKEGPGMEVFLHLPAGKRRVLSIEPTHFDVGLLGSDFGYRDVRMTLPTEGFDLRVLGSRRMLERTVWAVEATPTGSLGRAHAWPRSVYYLTAEPSLLLGADHYDDADPADPVPKNTTPKNTTPKKRMRVEGLRQDDGVWTATRIVIETEKQRSSVLTLLAFQAHRQDLGSELFTAESLPQLGVDSSFEVTARGVQITVPSSHSTDSSRR